MLKIVSILTQSDYVIIQVCLIVCLNDLYTDVKKTIFLGWILGKGLVDLILL